jgi:hypothetical protein
MQSILAKFITAEQKYSIQAMDHFKELARNNAVDIYFPLVMSI